MPLVRIGWVLYPALTMSDVDLYDYRLPRDRIAQHPLKSRADARLMVVDRRSGEIAHHHIRDLPDLLDPGDALVLNNSRVILARLVGYRESTGGRWQGLFLREDPDTGLWRVLSKTRGRLREGEVLVCQDREARDSLPLEVVARLEGGELAVRPAVAGDAAELLRRTGRVPLPPYIRDGQMTDEDLERYQTVFAQQEGSIAAPTAGLHFTDDLLTRLEKAGVDHYYVTLHVGLGTFRPIATDSLEQHKMHAEWGQIDGSTRSALAAVRRRGHRVVAIGTTAVRVLESAAASSAENAAWAGETDLFIRPPYKFRAIDALLTNFHLPKSTLLVLVCAFAGRELVMQAYEAAIDEGYRFYSYGDAMLIL